jgi:hypothetical protein
MAGFRLFAVVGAVFVFGIQGADAFESEVFINGKCVGVHRGGYDPFSYDITSFLKPGDARDLIARVFDPNDNGAQPRGKQTLGPGGIMYTSSSGIWLRRHFNPGALTPAQMGSLCISDYHNDTIDVYLNGVSAYQAGGDLMTYENQDLSPKGRQAIIPNADNMLAVKCDNHSNDHEYFDVGLSLPTADKP